MSFTVSWLRPAVMLCSWPDSIVDSELELSMAAHDMLLAHHTPLPYWALHEALGGAPDVSAKQRRRLGDWIEQEKDRNHRSIRAAVLVTPSPFLRGLVTAMSWVASTEYPRKTFQTRDEALGWIDAHAAQGARAGN